MYIGTLDPVSNRATWRGTYQITDADTGELIDFSDADEITVEVRDPQSKRQMFSATMTGGEVTIVDTGTFTWLFSSDQMRTLCAKVYEVGAVIAKDDEDVQLLIGNLPVLDGIVS